MKGNKDLVNKILKAPHLTEKTALLEEKSQYVFKVAKKATKPAIKKAIESFYGVKVRKVNIIKIPPKKRRRGVQEGKRPGYKKAVVFLKKGEKIQPLTQK